MEKLVKIAVEVKESLHDNFKRNVAQRKGFIKWFVVFAISAALTNPDKTIREIVDAADACTYGGCKDGVD